VIGVFSNRLELYRPGESHYLSCSAGAERGKKRVSKFKRTFQTEEKIHDGLSRIGGEVFTRVENKILKDLSLLKAGGLGNFS